ncbi:hypothetical protein [Kingella oralis]|nr:hypothetical protein [Kingella oralis]
MFCFPLREGLRQPETFVPPPKKGSLKFKMERRRLVAKCFVQ